MLYDMRAAGDDAMTAGPREVVSVSTQQQHRSGLIHISAHCLWVLKFGTGSPKGSAAQPWVA
jgi:hypothetical protein